MDPTVELLSKMMEFNTVNDPENGIRSDRKCADFMRDHLREEDIEASVMESGGYFTVHGTLGKEDPSILLLAHFDIVPIGSENKWNYPPMEMTVVNDRAYGRGVVDDKGNVACILTSLVELKERGVKDVAFAITGDEEVGGANGAGKIAQILRPRYVINGDGPGLEIINRRRNIFIAKIRTPKAERRTKGEIVVKKFSTETPGRETRHSAYFLPGVDSHAFLQASEHALREALLVSKVTGTFIKSNVVPDEIEAVFVRESDTGSAAVVDENLTSMVRALLPLSRLNFETRTSSFGINALPNVYRFDGRHNLQIDIRAMTDDMEVVKRAMEAAVKEILPRVDIEMTSGHGCLYTDPSSEIVKMAKEVASKIGVPPRVVEREGASDSRFFSPRGIECLDFGPLGGNIHGPNEYLILSSLERTTKFYTELVYRLVS